MTKRKKSVRLLKKEGVVQYLNSVFLLFGAKVLDSAIATGKTLFIQKGKCLSGAMLVALSQLLFLTVIKEVLEAKSSAQMYAVAIGAGVGTFITLRFNAYRSKDRLRVHTLLSDDVIAMQEAVEYMRRKKIVNTVTDGYTKEWGHTLVLTVYAETYAVSEQICAYLEESNKRYKHIKVKV